MSHLPAVPAPERFEQIVRRVRGVMGPAVREHRLAHDELTLLTQPEALLPLLRFLRDDEELQFRQLIDLCGVDYPTRARRFEVVYHLLSLHQNIRVRVSLETDETTPVPSLTALFPNADWYEREAFDLYGVLFSQHPDLRRILTDYNFTGHPMRKDFPTTGYVEVRYDAEQGQVVYEPVKLDQQYRKFDFLSPWEGMPRALPGDEKAQKGGPVAGG